MKKKITQISLIIIVIIVAIVNFSTIQWGLPNEMHPRGTYNCDETTYAFWLTNLKPQKLDFDPKIYFSRHVSVYYTGAVLGLGYVLGIYDVDFKDTKTFFLQNSDNYAKIFVWLRLFWGKIPLLLLTLLSFFIGRKLVDEKLGLLFAGVVGLLPTFIVNGNYATENMMLPFLTALSYWFAINFNENKKNKYLILASIVPGVATGFKESGFFAYFFIILIILMNWQNSKWKLTLQRLVLSGFVAFLAFSVTSPYYVKFLATSLFYPDLLPPDRYGSTGVTATSWFKLNFELISFNILNILKINFVQTGGIAIFSFLGFLAFQAKNTTKIVVFYLFCFYLVSVLSLFASDSRITPIAYFLALYGILGFYWIVKKISNSFFKLILWVGVLGLFLLYVCGITYRFIEKDNRQLASRWMQENLFTSTDTINLACNEEPNYAFPDIILQEWSEIRYQNELNRKNQLNIHFIIPDSSLVSFASKRVTFPSSEKYFTAKKRLKWSICDDVCIQKKTNWIKTQKVDYVMLSGLTYKKDAKDFSDGRNSSTWYSTLNNDVKFRKIYHLPAYDFLGLSRLLIFTWETAVYQKT